MQLSEAAVETLKRISKRELTRNIHPEDKAVYEFGLHDGNKILAEWVLEQLQEVRAEEPEKDA